MTDERECKPWIASDDLDRELKEAGIQKTASPGDEGNGEGIRFIFPMGRNPITYFPLALFWPFWIGGLTFMGFRCWENPHFLPPFILVFIVVLGVSVLLTDLLFYRSVVDVSQRGIAVTGGLFGRGAIRWIDAADIQKIDCKRSLWAVVGIGRVEFYYNLVIVRHNGKRVTIGKRIPSQTLATAISQQIEQAMTV